VGALADWLACQVADGAEVSAIATATSTALDAAIPTITVSGAVASARIASATSPSSRERGTYPSALRRKETWASRNSAGPPKVKIRSTEGDDREAKRHFVARMGDRELVADDDADQREHHQHQRPCSPPPNTASVRGVLSHLDPDRLGALEVAPPKRDGSRESDRQREQTLDFEGLVSERITSGKHTLA
jgi:hypothetical protein